MCCMYLALLMLNCNGQRKRYSLLEHENKIKMDLEDIWIFVLRISSSSNL